MVVTVNKQASHALRPINLNRDLPQVTSLLELVFNQRVSRQNQVWLGYHSQTWFPFLARLNPMASRLSPGFVWEENGRILGNATLLSTKRPDRYIVVNVAVHPGHRRRGIAYHLMQAIIQQVTAQSGRSIILQVVKDNHAAIQLYRSLSFRQLGSVTNWYSRAGNVHPIEDLAFKQPVPRIRELRGHEWQAAYQLDKASLPPDLNWPDPLSPKLYKRGFAYWLDSLFSGRQTETWTIHNKQQQLIGMSSIYSEWGRHHSVTMRVHPTWQGELERPLLAKVIRRLSYLPRRHVYIDHPDDDQMMNKLLREANFRPRRTLTHMRLDLS